MDKSNYKCESFMAQIPYIAHKQRLFKAYKKIRRLVLALCISNIIWAIVVGIIVFVG